MRRGRLVVAEGIDGSGKSTRINLLHRWPEARSQPVFLTEWNSSDLAPQATRRGKKNLLTPTTFSLLHATDFVDRLTCRIVSISRPRPSREAPRGRVAPAGPGLRRGTRR